MLLIVALVVTAVSVAGYRARATTGACSPDTAPDADETDFVTLLNQYRASRGVGVVTVSPRLTQAATWMAEDLAANGYFSHTDTLGRLPWDRAVDCGYPSTTIGENILGGTFNPATALANWKSSPGHNANMLNPQWRVIGVARVPGGVYGVTWVTDFGVYVDASIGDPVSMFRAFIPEIARE